MVSSVKGSAFNFGDNGVFYSAIDFGCRKTLSAAANTTKINAALVEMDAAGGGVILVPQGIAFNPVTFPVTANKLAIWTVSADAVHWQGNSSIDFNVTGNVDVSGHVKATGALIARGEFCVSQQIVDPVTGASIQMGAGIQFLILNHAATIASLNVVLPETPTDGATVRVSARSEITVLNLYAAAGSSIEIGHTVASLAASTSVGYTFNAATAKWYKV